MTSFSTLNHCSAATSSASRASLNHVSIAHASAPPFHVFGFSSRVSEKPLRSLSRISHASENIFISPIFHFQETSSVRVSPSQTHHHHKCHINSATSSLWRNLRGGPVHVRATSIDLSSGVRPSSGIMSKVEHASKVSISVRFNSELSVSRLCFEFSVVLALFRVSIHSSYFVSVLF
ncbi:hypothetical protein LR48_Vigan08g051500 [Vigna angularis]|uniref:Uncharacterized protein n=1 Tax=Phaseolus angularis TaxID=3914 RepID=A0A0L9V3T4_PHAAN|nr:hypothetical protein LR48_Vigan08g051500 [Vigna angularis]